MDLLHAAALRGVFIEINFAPSHSNIALLMGDGRQIFLEEMEHGIKNFKKQSAF